MLRKTKTSEEPENIDKQLLELLMKRIRIVRQKGEVIPFSLSEDIARDIAQETNGQVSKDVLQAFIENVFSVSSFALAAKRVAFLGPEGTFTHQAALSLFGGIKAHACSTVEDVFADVIRRDADVGVAAVENSTEGMVNDTYDMLVSESTAAAEVRICGEIYMPITQNVLAKEIIKPEEITQVLSHPQALRQCQRWLADKAKNATLSPTLSTIAAVEAVKVSKERGMVAIGPAIASEIYRLVVVFPQVQDLKNNTTRFVVIGKFIPKPQFLNKTTIAFALEDRLATLRDTLTIFDYYKINLKSIRTRPRKADEWALWKDWFFVDLEAHIEKEEDHMKKVLEDLNKSCIQVKFLGSYPAERDPREAPKI